MGINEATFFSLFSTLSIRREVTVFFYQSEVKEASGMLNIHFRLARIDALDRIEEAFSKKNKSIISVFVIIEF